MKTKPKTIEDLKKDAKVLEDMILKAEEVLPPMEIEDKRLKPKELMFISHYLTHGDPRKATLAAGWKDCMYGYKILERDYIQHEIDRRTFARDAVQIMNKDVIMSELFLLMYDARNDTKQDRQTILKCLDMIAKMNGIYAPENQINVTSNVDKIKIEIIKPNGNTNDEGDSSN